jgi:hypothetical protein
MTKIALDVDEGLMPVEYPTVHAPDCGGALEDARTQAKQEIDRIVNQGDIDP